MNSYRFFYRGNQLVCSLRDSDKSSIFTGEKAYSMFKKINKMKLSSVKVNQNKDNKAYFVLKGENSVITIKDLDYDDTRTLKINDLDNFDPASYTLTHGRDPFLMDNLPGVLLDILIRQLQKKDKPC